MVPGDQLGRRWIDGDVLAATPFAGFLLNRGALFATPGSGFVQAPASGLAETFANSTYATGFQALSPVRLFSPIGSNVTDVQFFFRSGLLPATTRGFGAVFADVDQPDGSGPAPSAAIATRAHCYASTEKTVGCCTAASRQHHPATQHLVPRHCVR